MNKHIVKIEFSQEGERPEIIFHSKVFLNDELCYSESYTTKTVDRNHPLRSIEKWLSPLAREQRKNANNVGGNSRYSLKFFWKGWFK